ncbi:hypothetical protein C4D60_Mb08t30930 [Musa balbisiana]|uniref:Uncharacterized protein n=1 Tax=Musa balbisiana TaxID=52838 RepID=A0A4S8K7Q7_MUSBA|nr:hypothetical protein C4D60_Mb08t30930 [Musa balbisiana]
MFPSFPAPKAGATSSPALQSCRCLCYLPSCGFGLNNHSIDADMAYRGRSGGPGPALGASPNISASLEEALEHSKLHCSLITTQHEGYWTRMGTAAAKLNLRYGPAEF